MLKELLESIEKKSLPKQLEINPIEKKVNSFTLKLRNLQYCVQELVNSKEPVLKKEQKFEQITEKTQKLFTTVLDFSFNHLNVNGKLFKTNHSVMQLNLIKESISNLLLKFFILFEIKVDKQFWEDLEKKENFEAFLTEFNKCYLQK